VVQGGVGMTIDEEGGRCYGAILQVRGCVRVVPQLKEEDEKEPVG
jgi:hypothetical protein